MCSFQSISEIDTEIDRRKKHGEDIGNTVQPGMFVVDNEQQRSYYCVIETLRYKLPSTLAMLDSTFQVHQVFNLQYQKDCHNPWTFIQRFIYGISTSYDRKAPCVATLENALVMSET